MVALAPTGSREIIMRKLTAAAAVALIAAASFLSVMPWHAAYAPLGSISPHELTLAAPAMVAGEAPDAF
jgi:hypothetical protein